METPFDVVYTQLPVNSLGCDCYRYYFSPSKHNRWTMVWKKKSSPLYYIFKKWKTLCYDGFLLWNVMLTADYQSITLVVGASIDHHHTAPSHSCVYFWKILRGAIEYYLFFRWKKNSIDGMLRKQKRVIYNPSVDRHIVVQCIDIVEFSTFFFFMLLHWARDGYPVPLITFRA